MPKSTRTLIGAVAVALILAIPGTAWAQEDEVFVDPNSPAGTEYELPLDRAREQAGGATGGSISRSNGGSATDEAPLFGEGVRRASISASVNGSVRNSPKADPGRRGKAAASTPEAVRATVHSPTEGSKEWLPIGGVAGGLLVIGTLAGLTVRRLSGRPDAAP